MPFYYYDEDGNKCGPFSRSRLKMLSESYAITPKTIIETESGQKGRADQIRGLFIKNKKDTDDLRNLREFDFDGILSTPSYRYCERCGAPLKNDGTLCEECGYDCNPVEETAAHDPYDAKLIKNHYLVYITCYIAEIILTTFGIACLVICASKVMYAASLNPDAYETWDDSRFTIPFDDELWEEPDFNVIVKLLKYFSPIGVLLGSGTIFLGCLFGIISFIFMLILLYRIWKQIPPKMARTKPIFAVGLLFIPLFSLYWNFVAFYGLAVSLNESLKQAGIKQRVASGLALTVCILQCLLVIPGVQVALIVLVPIMLGNLKKGAMRLVLSEGIQGK